MIAYSYHLDLPSKFTEPVDLIVDALLGYQYTLRELPNEHTRNMVCDLIDWANENRAPVLSLDLPSGIDGSTGKDTSGTVWNVIS
jgi:NAD(P)H-hydrate repair Nnr-like enzyme with NAD(P)H-hydrate epimerase domain